MGRPPEPTFHQPPATIGRPPDYMGDCNDEGLLESCCPDWSEMNHYDPMETYMSSDLTSEPATFMRDDRDIHFSPLSLDTGAGSSTLLLLLGVDYETTYSAPEDPLDCDFDLNIPDDNCRPTTPIHGMVPAYCCYCIAKESATAATGFDRWAKHTRSRGGTNNMPPYTYGELFKRFMNLCLSEDRLDQRTRPTPQRLPRHWADSVDKNNTMAAINVGSWLRTCLPRGMHTLEPPFHKVYPRLSDPPLDN